MLVVNNCVVLLSCLLMMTLLVNGGTLPVNSVVWFDGGGSASCASRHPGLADVGAAALNRYVFFFLPKFFFFLKINFKKKTIKCFHRIKRRRN